MSVEIVHISYPAPIRYIPKGARNERFTFRQMQTPARLRTAGIEEFRHVLSLPERTPVSAPQHFYEFEGRLWHWVKQGTYFKSFLSGEIDLSDRRSMDYAVAFWATPLCAVYETTPSGVGPVLYGAKAPMRFLPRRPSRGENVDLKGVRRIVEDGEHSASVQAKRYLEERVVLTNQGVFIRATGPLATSTGSYVGVDVSPRMDLDSLYDFRLDKTEDMVRFWEGNHGPRIQDLSDIGGFLSSIDAGLLEDDDIFCFVNKAPRFLLRQLGYVLESSDLRGGDEAKDALMVRIGELQSWHIRGMTGSISMEEAELVTLLVRDVTREALENKLHPWIIKPLGTFARFVDEIVLPRLREAHMIAEEDVDAVAGLGIV